MLPIELKHYFWDVKFDKLNVAEKKEFIVSRILEKGSDSAIKWVFQSYSLDEIKRIVSINLNLSAATYNLWTNVLQLNVYTS